MTKRINKKSKKVSQISKPEFFSAFDVYGSYTGTYLLGELEEPVQDVDDL
ncbi:MAG: hypothetical protein IJW13_01140 [Clostridia bacterium]|nr:hypothetical protein [Clostridia bacterium]